jgi:hypothetical protein
MTGASLTFEKIMQAKRQLDALCPPIERGYDPFGLRPFAGLKVFEAPEPAPKLSLSRECAELVGPEFAAKMNCWLLIRFGRQEDIFKDKAYILGNYGIVLSKQNMGLLARVTT